MVASPGRRPARRRASGPGRRDRPASEVGPVEVGPVEVGPVEVGEQQVTPVDAAEAYRVAREIALRRLESRDRTRAELASTLRDRETPDTVAAAVLDRLTEVGLVDDTRFARTWVETRQRTRGLAGRALGAELRQRGVADEIVAEAVEVVDPETEERTALALARDRVARTRGLAPEVVTRRVAGQLARRGYSAGVAFRAVRTAVAEVGPTADVEGPDESL